MKFRTLAIALMFMVGAMSLQAGTITPDFPTPFGSGSAYKYSVTLSNGESFQNGDFFTLYDFSTLAGYTSISESGLLPSFVLDIDYALTPANGVIVNNDPTLLDIRFTYTGNSVLTGDLGTFTVFTPLGLDYHFVDSDLSENGGTVREVGLAIAPNAASAVPEPGSMALLASGLIGGLGMIRRKLGW